MVRTSCGHRIRLVIPAEPLDSSFSPDALSPERRRQAVDAARQKYGLSERLACRIVGQPQGTQRYLPALKPDEDELTRNIIYLASEYGRYGYRRVTALLNENGIE